MTDLKLQYKLESIPIIKEAILEGKNKSDYDQQLLIRSKFPFKVHNLIAVKIWESEVKRLRNEFYKHKKFI